MSFAPSDLSRELIGHESGLISIDIAEQRENETLLMAVPGEKKSEAVERLLAAYREAEVTVNGTQLVYLPWGENTVIYLDASGRGNEAQVDPELELEHWDAVGDGLHNSNSFLTFWRGAFWLIHASSPYHFATPECKLVLWRSPDAREWTQVTTFQVPDEDIRDPKLAVIQDRLFVYVLKSLVEDGSEPYTTAVTYTDDGLRFSPLTELFELQGWLFWNPRTFDGQIWYVPAYWGGHGNSIILKTTDGLKFEPISFIHRGKQGLLNDMNDETDFTFLGDGRLLSVQRLEYAHGINSDPRSCTNITVAQAPYTQWQELGKDYTSRLDGPSMFSYNGRAYCVARRSPVLPEDSPHNGAGGLTRKRTALYEVTEQGVVHLSDFPSAGDTAYGGCVLKDGFLYASYYSSDISQDFPWIVGMLSPSNIRMVKIPLANVERLADQRKREYGERELYRFVAHNQ